MAWSPHFVDYLFLTFNTSAAFSPADTDVLSRWAKLGMMTQALISRRLLSCLRPARWGFCNLASRPFRLADGSFLDLSLLATARSFFVNSNAGVVEQAEAGDIAAARQLRGFLYREKRAQHERTTRLGQEAPSIASATNQRRDPVFYAIANMTWVVDRRTGDVTYRLDGRDAFVDVGEKINLIDNREATLAASLKVAQENSAPICTLPEPMKSSVRS